MNLIIEEIVSEYPVLVTEEVFVIQINDALSFLELTDVADNSYVGKEGFIPTVNETTGKLELKEPTGGGGSQTLAQTLVLGNTTNGKDINISDGDSILIDNGSKLKKGTTDAGNGGNNGISLKCSLDYEFKWEAGRLYIMEQDGITIRETKYNFGNVPSATDDTSKGFTLNSRWILDNGNTYVCTDASIGVAVWELQPIIPTKTSDLINDGDNGISHFISLEDLPSNIVFYPTNVASDISGYVKIVTSITDPSYNTTAVDISTGAITTANQLISSLATSPNIIVGNPGVFNITTIGNIRRISGSGEASFFFRVYKRTLAGVETLVATSDNTIPVIDGGTYVEFSATAIWNDGIFLDTDRVVMKYYANRISGGSNPTYQFQFGGITPVRTLVPIPLSVVPSIGLDGLNDVNIATPLDAQVLTYESSSSLWKNKILPIGTLLTESFSYSGSQIITLLNNYSQVHSVSISGGGALLRDLEYTLIAPNQIDFGGRLEVNDYIIVQYSTTPVGIQPYYSQAQVDILVSKINIETVLGKASNTNNGYLSSSDWIEFKTKLRGHETFRGVNYSNNSTTEVVSGGVVMSTTGSVIARSVASTNYATKQIRKGFYGSVASAGRYTSTRGTALLWFMGGGFKFVCDFHISDTAFGSGCRQFYGMMGQTTDLTYSDTILVEAMTNIIGVGSDALDTNLQIFHNDSTGICTKIDLGVNFPANRTAGVAMTTMYSIELHNDNNANDVKYCVRNEETGSVAMGVIVSNLPLNTQGLNFTASRCMGGGITNTGQFDLKIIGVYSL